MSVSGLVKVLLELARTPGADKALRDALKASLSSLAASVRDGLVDERTADMFYSLMAALVIIAQSGLVTRKRVNILPFMLMRELLIAAAHLEDQKLLTPEMKRRILSKLGSAILTIQRLAIFPVGRRARNVPDHRLESLRLFRRKTVKELMEEELGKEEEEEPTDFVSYLL